MRLESSGPILLWPYVTGRLILDMEQLGDRGLYLITGDTGGGKTTLFDAAGFGSHGSASGRKPGRLRGICWTGSENVCGDGIFLIMKKYRIHRSPEYMRAKQRGSGETRRSRMRRPRKPDGSMVTGRWAVTLQVEELLGLTGSVFPDRHAGSGTFSRLLSGRHRIRGRISGKFSDKTISAVPGADEETGPRKLYLVSIGQQKMGIYMLLG